MFEGFLSWFQAPGKLAKAGSYLRHKSKLAMWSAVVATSSFGLGAVANEQLTHAEQEAQALGESGQAAGAIQALSQANVTARETLHERLQAGLADSTRRLDGELEDLDGHADQLNAEELDEGVDDLLQAYAEQRVALVGSYMKTVRRERLQLETMSRGWGPEGQALAQRRIAELEAHERKIEDLLLDSYDDAGAEALGVDTTPTPEATIAEREERAPKIQGYGLTKQLEVLAAQPDTVASQRFAAQPDTVAGEWSEWSDAWADGSSTSDADEGWSEWTAWTRGEWGDDEPAAKPEVNLRLGD